MNPWEFTEAYNDLTRFFLHMFMEGRAGGNVVFSPFSVLSLFSLLADATGGKTREEILDALFWGPERVGLPEQLHKAKKKLTRCDPDRWDPEHADFSSHFHSANAVCIREEYRKSVYLRFEKKLMKLYDGRIFTAADLANAVNGLVSENTDGMLPILEEVFRQDSVLAMINTVDFDAMWRVPYEDDDIKKGIFHNCDGTTRRVEMLHGCEDELIENEFLTGFVKDFQQCGYSFMALLPREEGPEGLRDIIRIFDFHDLMRKRKRCIVHTVMPEFSFAFREDLSRFCDDLEIRDVFDPENADFSSVARVPLFADRMIHQAKIDVNRYGVKASAASMMILCGAVPPEREETVRLDRPFIFAIMHEGERIPVFAGVVNQL